MIRRLPIVAVLAAAPLALGLTAASAHADPVHHFTATAACQVENPNCTEPVEAQSPLAADNYVQIDDAAVTASGGYVTINPNNNAQDGSQDWVWAAEGYVPPPGGGDGGFGFTTFDNANYAFDPVFEIEWTPFGIDSGQCAQLTRYNQVVIRPCNGHPGQAWIVTTHMPLVPSPGAPGYVYALSANQENRATGQSATAQHHYCLTGTNGAVSGIMTASRCRSNGTKTGTDQQFGALP